MDDGPVRKKKRKRPFSQPDGNTPAKRTFVEDSELVAVVLECDGELRYLGIGPESAEWHRDVTFFTLSTPSERPDAPSASHSMRLVRDSNRRASIRRPSDESRLAVVQRQSEVRGCVSLSWVNDALDVIEVVQNRCYVMFKDFARRPLAMDAFSAISPPPSTSLLARGRRAGVWAVDAHTVLKRQVWDERVAEEVSCLRDLHGARGVVPHVRIALIRQPSRPPDALLWLGRAGPPWAELPRDAARSWDHAWTRWQHLLTALAEVHDQGYVHADVHPGNVCDSMEGDVPVMLIDVGSARPLRPEEGNAYTGGRRGGAWDYMPPEQFDDPMTIDATSDLYAAVSVLFFLLDGTPPFHPGPSKKLKVGNTRGHWRRTAAAARDTWEERIPRGMDPTRRDRLLEALVDAWAADRSDRPPSITTFRERIGERESS